MKILFVASSNNPFEVTQGSSQRSSLLLKAITNIASVDVISFCSTNIKDSKDCHIVFQSCLVNNVPNEGRLRKFMHLLTPWNPETVFNVNKSKADIIDEIVSKNNYDYIVIRYIPAAIECGLWKYANRLIIDIDDMPYTQALNQIDFAKTLRNKIYYYLYAHALKVTVREIVKSVALSFVSNPADLLHNKTIFLPNVPYYIPTDTIKNIEKRNRLIFVGDLYYPINQNGITHFLQKVFPLVQQKVQDVELHIVGRINDESLKAKWESNRGVTVTGFVPNIENEYAEARIAVIPMYRGAGTCIKVLEAMQYKKVCVTTPVGFRGYDKIFTTNQDCLVANTDSEFAKHIVKIIHDEELKNTIINNAYNKQQIHYTKPMFNKIVIDGIKRIHT